MTEIAPGIMRWAAPHPEWRTSHPWGHEVASFALEHAGGLLLVDPLLPPDAEALWAELDNLVERATGVSILITNPYHARSSGEIHERYATRAPVTIYGHPAVAKRLRGKAALTAIGPDATLPAGILAFPIGRPRRHEQPLYFPSHRALAFGDSVVGVDGTLRVWEALGDDERRRAWYRDRFLPTLEPLLALDVAHVLVTHGPPIVGGGREALARALATAPWSPRSA